MDQQIRARIPMELSEQINEYINTLNDLPGENKINVSDLVRTSLREYMDDNKLGEAGKIVKLRVDKSKYLNDDMEEVSLLIKELSDKNLNNRSMSYICMTLRKLLILMMQ